MKERIQAILQQFPLKRILVVGDFYLDEYFHCSAKTFSPEAPVPRAIIRTVEHVPGCAGNVAVALKMLGAQVICTGVIGNDEKSRILQNKLLEKGIITTGLQTDSTRVTGVFSRIIIGEKNEIQQHIVRFDLENSKKINPEVYQQFIHHLEQYIPKIDLLFIADYDETKDNVGLITKEFMENIFHLAKKYNFITMGTTRRQTHLFKNVDIFICNKKEAGEITKTVITNEADLSAVASTIKNMLQVRTLIITKGAEGVSILGNKNEIHFPSFVTKIVDVCGAGDSFSSMYALSSLTDATEEEKGNLASHAAAVAASKPGTALVSPEEILASIKMQEKGKQRKIEMNYPELRQHLRLLKKEGKKIVFTNGYFDLIHAGHIEFLHKAKEKGDILVVAINSDRSTRENKGSGRPFMNEHERLQILSSLDCVDFVTIFDELTPLKIISVIKPDVLVKGSTYKVDEIVGKDIIETNGCAVKIIPVNSTMSTDALIERIYQMHNENKRS